MSTEAHSQHNYIKIFVILTVLTVIEVAATFLGLAKIVIGTILVTLAIWKATLVAMHFMHLKIEKTTLAIVAIIPFILCLFLTLMLLPDIYPH